MFETKFNKNRIVTLPSSQFLHLENGKENIVEKYKVAGMKHPEILVDNKWRIKNIGSEY